MDQIIYRVAVIGLGAVGTRMISNMHAHDRFQPVVGFDTSADACSALLAQKLDIEVTNNFGELLDRNDIDVLYVSTPPKSHAEYVRHGLIKGWKIFCEKPLGVDIEDSESLAQEMNAAGLDQGVNFVYSGAPAALRAKQLMDAGLIGKVVGAELDLRFSTWPRGFQAHAPWLGERSEGGFTRECVSHFAYLTMLLLGQPTLKGQAVAHFDTPGGAEDMLQAVWATDAGKVAVSGVVGGDRNDIVSYRILGTNGCLRFDNWYNLLHETRDGSESVLDAEQQLPAAAYKGQLDQLAIQYDTNKQRLATFDDALAVQKLIEKMIA